MNERLKGRGTSDCPRLTGNHAGSSHCIKSVASSASALLHSSFELVKSARTSDHQAWSTDCRPGTSMATNTVNTATSLTVLHYGLASSRASLTNMSSNAYRSIINISPVSSTNTASTSSTSTASTPPTSRSSSPTINPVTRIWHNESDS